MHDALDQCEQPKHEVHEKQQYPQHAPTVDGDSESARGADDPNEYGNDGTGAGDTGSYSIPLLRNRQHHTPPPIPDLRLYFDGGSRVNPGEAGSGSIIVRRNGELDDWNIVWWKWHYLGESATNNAAEHTGLALGLEAATTFAAHHLIIIGDRQRVLDQLTGAAKCSDAGLRGLLNRSQTALRSNPNYTTRHSLRSGNKLADWLANQAMDHRTTRASTTDWTETDTTLTNMLHNVNEPDFTGPRTRATLLTDIDAVIERIESLPSGRRWKRID